MKTNRRRVVIVGSGLGGLSAACHLAGTDADITVIERAEHPGGRAGVIVDAGFRFDTGPTVLTMPDLVEHCFEACGESMSAYLELRPVDPTYRACFADGSEIAVHHGPARLRDEIARVCGERDAAALDGFVSWLARLYELEMPRFIDRNYDSVADLCRPLSPALQLLKLGAFGKLERAVARFFDDERLRRIFTFQSMYAGLAPHQALAIYAVIAYMDTIRGVHVPVGGMHELPQAMARAARHAGVTIRYGETVERIVLSHGLRGEVRGVTTSTGELVEADVVIANPDLPFVYRTLLGGLPAPRAARRGLYSPSAVVWHVGARGQLPANVEHHNIHFGERWRSSFEEVIGRGVLMSDPSILVTVASLHDRSLAPEGGHNLYVLEPVPNLDGRIDWTERRGAARDALAAHVATLGYPVDDIVTERFVDPLEWERHGMERGTPFGLAHTFRQTGPFRPNNVDKRCPGLVLCGSGTVPGVGVPMVLISGRLAAQRTIDYLKAGRHGV